MSDVTDRHDALWAGNRKEMEEILAALDEPAKEEARLWALRSDAAAGVANFGQMTHITPVTAVPQCMCKDRALSECPGEWEPGCDLGANPAHVGYATPEETAEAFKDLREVSAIFQDAKRYRWLKDNAKAAADMARCVVADDWDAEIDRHMCGDALLSPCEPAEKSQPSVATRRACVPGDLTAAIGLNDRPQVVFGTGTLAAHFPPTSPELPQT